MTWVIAAGVLIVLLMLAGTLLAAFGIIGEYYPDLARALGRKLARRVQPSPPRRKKPAARARR